MDLHAIWDQQGFRDLYIFFVLILDCVHEEFQPFKALNGKVFVQENHKILELVLFIIQVFNSRNDLLLKLTLNVLFSLDKCFVVG